VIPNVTGAVAPAGSAPAQIREWLVAQVDSPVRWEASLRAALALGLERALLLGPGGMARGHLKRIERRFPTLDMDQGADRVQLGVDAEEKS
jgi:[acyl-carrier-protein] S-malonyltransferase